MNMRVHEWRNQQCACAIDDRLTLSRLQSEVDGGEDAVLNAHVGCLLVVFNMNVLYEHGDHIACSRSGDCSVTVPVSLVSVKYTRAEVAMPPSQERSMPPSIAENVP